MSPRVRPVSAAGQRVLDELAKLGPELEAAVAKSDELYAKRNKLYIRGDRLKVQAADMATAQGLDRVNGGEGVRQVLTRHRKDQADKAKAKNS